MKRILALVFAAVMMLSIVSCGEKVTPMTYEEYAAAALDSEVIVETYVQAKQSWWEEDGQGYATLYTQDENGAYFIYKMACPKEDYDKFVDGTKLRIKGFKGEYAGEVEIMDATYEILDGNYVAPAMDITALLADENIIDHQNKRVSFKGMTVVASKNADGAELPYLYNWDGSGQDGDDIYFNVSYNGQVYTMTIESYLCGKDTDVYVKAMTLQIGQTIDMEGFLYWYNGVNPHITSITDAQ